MDVLETYLTSIEDPVKQEKLRAVFAAITKKFPDLVPLKPSVLNSLSMPSKKPATAIRITFFASSGLSRSIKD